MKNKRAQGMSTSTIILLILGIVILVVLILGFSTGWSSFKKIIRPTNVDDVVEECASICGLQQEYSFCSAERTLRVNEEDVEVKTSCFVLATSSQFSKYNIAECSSITCDLACENIVIDGESGQIVSEGTAGAYDVSTLANDLEEGEICVIA